VAGEVLSGGRDFIRREGRLIERRLFAALFEGADATGAVEAVRAYRNADGGLGHGLEPDKRCPASLPIDVEIALDVLIAATGRGPTVDNPVVVSELHELLQGACTWLESVASADGAVPLGFPVIESYPHAEHWSGWAYVPGLNPTAGLAGRLHQLGVSHPWLTRATEWTWSRLQAGFDEDAHALSEVLVFLAHAPDRARAEHVVPQLRGWLDELRWFRARADDPAYGLTPLHYAPSPDSPWRSLFEEETIDAHLVRMIRDQQADGGWPITWEPPSEASTLEWRGIETLRALRTLAAYGRL
jgi:hypothetical protein